jgi:transporter family-2 protein
LFFTFATMNYIYILLAFLTGLAVTIQAGVNANLRQMMANPVLAAAISFGSGFLSLLIVLIATSASIPALDTVKQVSWWKWTGGVIGAIYVTTVIISVPKIGTANLVSLSVAGQLVAAVILDHYGLLGFTLHPANGWRLLGVALIMAGVLLVVRN